jgi:glutathione-regulated potassium-efflux system ancillary protein KefC
MEPLMIALAFAAGFVV